MMRPPFAGGHLGIGRLHGMGMSSSFGEAAGGSVPSIGQNLISFTKETP